MKAKRSRATVPPPLTEIPGPDRDLLTHAYRTGLILAWKHDGERGYRVTVDNRSDEYVEITKLSSYLDKLRAANSR
ncbi:MAG TPA: hypothetical protein VMS64_30395 [Candidatus Methylomirabilis sp.]|nr:hypothetical protein [Candidatus Methylomirabilis sp.]